MTNPAAIQLDPKMRESIDSIKAELGKGKVVIRPRQTGKTAALLEVIHENSPGMVDVFTCHANEAERFRCLYKEMFPGDEQPRILPFQWALSERVRGTTGRKWATDEVWPDAVINKAREYEFVTYLGGVGTPMCMDLHSN